MAPCCNCCYYLSFSFLPHISLVATDFVCSPSTLHPVVSSLTDIPSVSCGGSAGYPVTTPPPSFRSFDNHLDPELSYHTSMHRTCSRTRLMSTRCCFFVFLGRFRRFTTQASTESPLDETPQDDVTCLLSENKGQQPELEWLVLQAVTFNSDDSFRCRISSPQQQTRVHLLFFSRTAS